MTYGYRVQEKVGARTQKDIPGRRPPHFPPRHDPDFGPGLRFYGLWFRRHARTSSPSYCPTKPELVLVDLNLPGRRGLELIKEIRCVDRKVKLLAISLHREAIYAARALRAGGDGYIVKQEDPDEFIHAIRDILEGHIYVSEGVMERRREGRRTRTFNGKTCPLDFLTDSEREILKLLGIGKSGSEIALQIATQREIAGGCSRAAYRKTEPQERSRTFSICCLLGEIWRWLRWFVAFWPENRRGFNVAPSKEPKS